MTDTEKQLLRDELLERGFSMAQVRRAVRALTPGALSFTKTQVFGCARYVGVVRGRGEFVREQRARDRGFKYESDFDDDVPFPR